MRTVPCSESRVITSRTTRPRYLRRCSHTSGGCLPSQEGREGEPRRPCLLGEEVGLDDNPHEPTVGVDHLCTVDPVPDEDLRGLVDSHVRAEGHNIPRHDVPRFHPFPSC